MPCEVRDLRVLRGSASQHKNLFQYNFTCLVNSNAPDKNRSGFKLVGVELGI